MNVNLGIDPVTTSAIAISLYRGGKSVADKMDEAAHAREAGEIQQARLYDLENVLDISSADVAQTQQASAAASRLKAQRTQQYIALGVAGLVIAGLSFYALK